MYKRQHEAGWLALETAKARTQLGIHPRWTLTEAVQRTMACLLYTSDAADERSSVDLGGRRIIHKKKKTNKKSS